MLENYEFRLFVSQEGYPEKPTKEAVSKIIFEPRQLTIEDALQLAVRGNAFCYNFNTNGRSTLPIKQKTTDNVSSTSIIFFYFDKSFSTTASLTQTVSTFIAPSRSLFEGKVGAILILLSDSSLP